jgi:RNA polymerase sigma-70 factor (ECF subfamily)
MPTPALASSQSVPGVSDAEIVRRVLAGDTAVFEVLMRRHNPLVYRTVRSILRDEAETEDAMQQAWLRCYAHLGAFAGQAAFSTWLVRIALTEALGRTRDGSRFAVVAEVPEDEEPFMSRPEESPEERAAAHEAVALVEQAIDSLPAHHRTVFVLRDVQGLSTAEVAESLGITEESVRIRLYRAHATVREALFARVRTSASEAFPFLAPRCNRIVAAVLDGIARET